MDAMKMKRVMGKVEPLGVSVCGKGIQFAFVSESNDCGVVLYDAKTGAESRRIEFPQEFVVGNVHTMVVQGITATEFLYQFYEDGKNVCDPFACGFCGNETYGSIAGVKEKKAYFSKEEYDWGEDVCPGLSYEESFVYLMHVRGFTMHDSSKVKAKGTFKGVEEKIPYLKELGITTVEFQPVYEFDEVYEKDGCREDNRYAKYASVEENGERQVGINYWGYAEGYYYAPKRSYSYFADPKKELKDLIKAFHANGMEVILQFYFPAGFGQWQVLNILRHWALTYHVDGFHIKGECRPMGLICGDPVLKKRKVWDYDFDPQFEMVQGLRRLGVYNDYYAQIMRRFVKGEDGLVGAVTERMRNQPAHAGVINYVTNYDGFTMMDLVSYDRKHNEENGENNHDGVDYNYSWNCGTEGPCKKKAVQALRTKQIKNFMSLLMLSQGTPLIFMGDEFGNSQGGNNNPYCLDNDTTWLNWNDLEKNRELFDYLKTLAHLRKEHPVLRLEKQLKQMDYISCGYPDLSYHGEEPWKPGFEPYSHQIGIMICGKYGRIDRRTEDASFYFGINMHWEAHEFALPNLPKDEKWVQCLNTEKGEEIVLNDMQKGTIAPRSICVFMSIKDEKSKK